MAIFLKSSGCLYENISTEKMVAVFRYWIRCHGLWHWCNDILIFGQICLATVTNTVKKYFEGGVDAVFKHNVNSDNARRVLDGRAEARIIELACGSVPEGHSRWTIRLLEEKSKIVLDTPVSHEAIRRA